MLVYARFPKDKEDRDHRYRYARYIPGSGWVDRELCQSGPWFPETPDGKTEREPHYSGGLTLDHSNPNRLVMSRLSRLSGQFEIEMWTTSDLGESWDKIEITANSVYLNVRPIIPRHFPSESLGKVLVMWMSGRYEYWTKYRTSLRYAVV